MYIKDRKIGSDENPLIIAEIGINHGGDLDTAKEMVDSAKRAGRGYKTSDPYSR